MAAIFRTLAARSTWTLLTTIFALSAFAAVAGETAEWRDQMQAIVPQGYLCHYTTNAITVDGQLDDAAWAQVPWTTDFVDIVGASKPMPRFHTRAKLLWDDNYLYIAADIKEPHVWATLTNQHELGFTT